MVQKLYKNFIDFFEGNIWDYRISLILAALMGICADMNLISDWSIDDLLEYGNWMLLYLLVFKYTFWVQWITNVVSHILYLNTSFDGIETTSLSNKVCINRSTTLKITSTLTDFKNLLMGNTVTTINLQQIIMNNKFTKFYKAKIIN